MPGVKWCVPAAETPDMTDPVVDRWARYGHERLYVRTPDGTRLGYWDCKAGVAVLAAGADRDAFDAALARHLNATGPTLSGAGSADASPDPAVATEAVPAQAVRAARRPEAPNGEPTPPASPTPAGPTPVGPAPAVTEPTADLPATAVATPVLPASEEPSWMDLAETRPGAAAREQAVALRKAAPVRTFIARAFGVRTDERAWRIGADGEEAVAARLDRLDDRWRVLHAVPVGEKGSDIDHVVVGPGGVFTVNAKHHPDASVWVGGDTFMVNGTRVPYVRNSRHEARRAARLLAAAGAPAVVVTGLVAVMGARGGWTVKAQPADGQVVVLRRKDLDGWLATRPHVLDDGQVERVHAVARRADTWP